MVGNVAARMLVVEGDITQIHVDAIVNAANESLLGGGGSIYSLKKIVGVTRGQMNKVAITWTNRWCNEPWLWQRGRQD